METLSSQEILFIMAGSLFILGITTFCMGIFVLVARAMGRDIRTIANQTARLAQKGITENVTGLIGNISALLNATRQLVRTAAGIGIFLTFMGLLLIVASYWLFLQINWPA
ncbi:MAG: hypothetical protein FVQ83_02125 [Chloroflexi bacterium]|nr:hypothetical protein [Chloroflexota bacterium]